MEDLNADRPRILIVTQSCGFPNAGTAETARVRAIASGLSQAGADVSVHVVDIMAPGRNTDFDNPASGVWRGVPFQYMHGHAQPVDGWLRRRVLEVRGLWRMSRAIRTSARSSSRTAVVVCSPGARVIWPMSLACAFARVPIVNERSEFPFVYAGEPGLLGRAYRAMYSATVFRLFDGVIVISALLERYARERTRRSSWVLRVPILVDAAAFACPGPPSPGSIGYAGGDLCHSEELFQLIGAVSDLAATHPDVHAQIMGGGDPDAIAALRAELDALPSGDRIELSGHFAADEMPARLCACAVLALPRADALFSTAGLPTKLGEYLATGRPVVVTATGDIPEYLTADVDAYVVAAGDPGAFTAALEQALYDPESVAIGSRGREVARARFDPTSQMRRVLEALEGSWAGRGRS